MHVGGGRETLQANLPQLSREATEVSDNADPQHQGLLLTASLVTSLVMLNSNSVAISLPTIGGSLNVPFAALEWVISAYMLAYAALLLAAGSFADIIGRQRTMVFGLAVFAT